MKWFPNHMSNQRYCCMELSPRKELLWDYLFCRSGQQNQNKHRSKSLIVCSLVPMGLPFGGRNAATLTKPFLQTLEKAGNFLMKMCVLVSHPSSGEPWASKHQTNQVLSPWLTTFSGAMPPLVHRKTPSVTSYLTPSLLCMHWQKANIWSNSTYWLHS